MAEPIIPPQPAAAQRAQDSTGASSAKAAQATSASPQVPEVKALQGSTTIDNKVSIEAEILAYRAVSKIAKQIAREFHQQYPADAGETPYWIIVLDDSLVAALTAHQAFVLECDLMAHNF